MQVICKNVAKLPGNDVAPPLEQDKQYEVLATNTCTKCGSKSYDVGLKSKYNFISCHQCKQNKVETILPNSTVGGVHWAHSSRFVEIGNMPG